MDAIALLKADHKVMNGLLKDLADTTSRGVKLREKLLEKIGLQVHAHMAVEEEIFYPALRAAGKNQDDEVMFYEAVEEHRAARDLVLPDLIASDVASAGFGGRAKVLRELIEHHAEEEEKEMFPRARELLGHALLVQLAEKMSARKLELGA